MKLKRLTIKLFSLLCVTTVLQIALYAIFPARWLRIAQFVEMQKLLKSGTNRSILFFGDSTVTTTAPDDHDQRSITAMFEAEIGGFPTINFSSPGYPPSLYHSFTKYFFTMHGEAPLYVYPINIRSLTSLLASTGFKLEKRALAHAHEPFVFPFIYPGLVFNRLPSTSPAEQLAVKLDRTVASVSGKRVYHYDTKLEQTIPEVQALFELGELLQQKQAQAVFYLTPLNCGLAKEVFGPEFETAVRENVALLQQQMTKRGYPLVDLTCSLGPEHFLDTEHLAESGRKFVAKQLADHVRKSGKLPSSPR